MNSRANKDAREIKLAESLKSLLALRAMKQADLARKSNVTPSVICEWVNGRIPSAVGNLIRVAEALQVTAEQLFYGYAKSSGIKYAEDFTEKRSEELQLTLPESGSITITIQRN